MRAKGPFPFMRLVPRVVLGDRNGYRTEEFEARMSRQCEDRTYADTASDVQDARILLISAFLQNDVFDVFCRAAVTHLPSWAGCPSRSGLSSLAGLRLTASPVLALYYSRMTLWGGGTPLHS
jgi:hypothetical protein